MSQNWTGREKGVDLRSPRLVWVLNSTTWRSMHFLLWPPSKSCGPNKGPEASGDPLEK